MNLNIIKKIFIIFCIYHAAVMLMMPNSASIVGRKAGTYFAPYANLIGLNGTWEFFSPDPPQPLFFDYRVYFEDSNGDEIKPRVQAFFPEWKTSRTLHPNHIRMKNTVRFFALNQKALEVAFVGWLCRKYQGATRVKINEIMEPVETIDKLSLGLTEEVERIPASDESATPAIKIESYCGENSGENI
jgi:hypothetical protein